MAGYVDPHVAALRQAIQTLYTAQDSASRQQADAWLQAFRTSPQAWRLCLELLSASGLRDYEQYFSANTLKYCCQKYPDITQPPILQQVLARLVGLLRNAILLHNWPVSAQLGSCTALLAVRAVAWEPYSIIPGLQSLIHQDQMLAVPGADMVGLIALLYCCASLPEACQSRYIVVHTHRRNAVLAAVQRSDVISPAISTALSMSLPICFSLAVQIIQGWCELGAAPANLDRTSGIIEQLFAAVLRPDSCSAAAECLSTLFSSHKAKSMSHVGLEPLLSVLLQQLQPWLSSFSATPAEELPKEVHVAACSVCCAAASSALLPTLSGHPQISGLLQPVLEHLLACLTNKHVDVVLTVLDFWQDHYVAALQGSLPGASKQALGQHLPLLQHLANAVMAGTMLPLDTAAAATADARDLPEEVRVVRRELASLLRSVTSLVGLEPMLQQMAAMVKDAISHQQQEQQQAAPPGSPSAAAARWVTLENLMYTANVVMGAHKDDLVLPVVRELVEAAAYSVQQFSEQSAKLSGTALTLLGGLPGWLVSQPSALDSVLGSISAALQSPDDKLSRNAATTINRLCKHASLASLIATRCGQWVQGVVDTYLARGGVTRRIGSEGDMSTEEFLLASICILACSVPSGQASNSSLLLYLARPKASEAHEKLLVLAAAQAGALSAQATADIAQQVAACIEVLVIMVESTAQVSSKEGGRRKGGGGGGGQSGGAGDGAAAAPSTGAGQQARGKLAGKQVGKPASGQCQAQQQPQQAKQQAKRQAPAQPAAQQAQHQSAGAGSNRDPTLVQAVVVDMLNAIWDTVQLLFSVAVVNPPVAHTLTTATSAFLNASMRCLASQARLHGVFAVSTAAGEGSMTGAAAGSSSGSPPSPGASPGAGASGGNTAIKLLQSLLPLMARLPPQMKSVAHMLELLSTCINLAHLLLHQAAKPFARPAAALPIPAPGTAAPALNYSSFPAGSVYMGSSQPMAFGSSRGTAMGGSPGMSMASSSGSFGSAPGMAAAAGSSPELQPSLLAAAAKRDGTSSPPSGPAQHGAFVDAGVMAALVSDLSDLVQAALGQACQLALAAGYADPDVMTPIFHLASVCLAKLPQCLGPSSGQLLDELLKATCLACKSYDADLCKATLEWIPQLFVACFKRDVQHLSAVLDMTVERSMGLSSQQAQQLQLLVGMGRVEQQTLALARGLIDSGAGSSIMLCLLMAAAGDMSPDMALPIASCMHVIWQAAGDARFGSWLTMAVQSLAPEHAPWARLKLEAKAGFIKDVLRPECASDVLRFKRILKSFCTNKKKAPGRRY